MNELSRMNYLDALGIDNYVSRSQLPGAAPTRRLAIVRKERPGPVSAPEVHSGHTASPTMPAVPDRASDRTRPDIPRLEEAAAGQNRVPAATEKSRDKTEAVRFSLAAIFVGHVAWIEELDGNPLATEQVQLVHAMARAISGEVQRPDVTQFDWPTHQNHQFDLGSEAAVAGVAGFLQRQIDQRKCRALVLLGKPCEARISLEQLGGISTVITDSTLAMLAEPSRKRQVWQDLQPLVLRV